MSGDTSVPLAIATLLLIEGKVNKKGVYTPEEIIDPYLFFDKYAHYCGKNLTGNDILIKKEINLY